MFVLLIDIGNSRLKWRYEEVSSNLSEERSVYRGAGKWSDFQSWLQSVGAETIQYAFAVSVVTNYEYRQALEIVFGQKLTWLSETPPKSKIIGHCYAKPERLGIDRYLAMLGAIHHVEQTAVELQATSLLVIDSGTALTIDRLQHVKSLSSMQSLDLVQPIQELEEPGLEGRRLEGRRLEGRGLESHEQANMDQPIHWEHKGGWIVPGVKLARDTLFASTEKVVDYHDESIFKDDHATLGQDTTGCVMLGTSFQQLALVEWVINQYPSDQVFITGGDGATLAERLNLIFIPDLIFDGIHSLCGGSFTP